MKRRKALKCLGLTASAGVALPFSVGLSSCNSKDPGPEVRYDGVVGIIGAGAAGLYAADILKSQGIKVRIFEASDRVGGRVRSIHLTDDAAVKTDFPIELGVDRISGTDGLWAKIIGELAIPVTALTESALDRFIIDGSINDLASLQTDPEFVAARNYFATLGQNANATGSLAQHIQESGISPRMQGILNSWLGNKYGSSNDRIGVRGLAESFRLLKRSRNENLLRSNPMQDALTSRFSAVVPTVECNTVIRNVSYSSENVLLTGEHINGTGEFFSATVDKVIVTVPVSILKNDYITFTPSLPPGKLVALSHIGMDACVRVVLDFKKNFWGGATGSIYGGVKAPEYLNAGFSRSDLNKTLSITVAGPKAEEFSSLGNDCIPLLLQELDAVFDGQASVNIRKDENLGNIFEFFDWTKHPYVKGGVSYITPDGSQEDRVTLGQPIDELLFFAGEATDVSGEEGTLNGALLSAQRVAMEVIDSIVKS